MATNLATHKGNFKQPQYHHASNKNWKKKHIFEHNKNGCKEIPGNDPQPIDMFNTISTRVVLQQNWTHKDTQRQPKEKQSEARVRNVNQGVYIECFFTTQPTTFDVSASKLPHNNNEHITKKIGITKTQENLIKINFISTRVVLQQNWTHKDTQRQPKEKQSEARVRNVNQGVYIECFLQHRTLKIPLASPKWHFINP